MAKKVILAVAGSGKTYHICHTLNPSKRNLIIAYTHENINNIKKELCDAYGCVPELTKVMTFHSFVYRNIILPYVPSISEHFHISNFDCRGVCMNEPPSQIIKENNKTRPNPQYISKDKFEHYINNNQNIYCSTFSELILQVKKGGQNPLLTELLQD